jgi:hypothetical protein
VTAGSAVAGEFAFATPAEWFAIDLPPTSSDLDRLARDLGAVQPELVDRHDDLRAMLSAFAVSTAMIHAVGAYAAFPGGPGELPATLLVSLLPMSGSTLDQIGREMSGADGAAPSSAMKIFDLPAGRTVRVERLIEPSPDDQRPVWYTVKYVSQIPGRDQAVVLTFGTPAIAPVDRLRAVFHQIACSLLINPTGQVQPPAEAH